MKRVFLGAIVFLSMAAPCFAKWDDSDCFFSICENPETSNMALAEKVLIYSKVDRRFFIKPALSKHGSYISALDLNGSLGYASEVSLRHDNNKVDYRICLSDQLDDNTGFLHLNLLDNEGLLVHSIYVKDFFKGHKGALYGSFNMNWATFEKVKYYDFSWKGKPLP